MMGRQIDAIRELLRRRDHAGLRALLKRYLARAAPAKWFGEMTERQKTWRANTRE